MYFYKDAKARHAETNTKKRQKHKQMPTKNNGIRIVIIVIILVVIVIITICNLSRPLRSMKAPGLDGFVRGAEDALALASVAVDGDNSHNLFRQLRT